MTLLMGNGAIARVKSEGSTPGEGSKQYVIELEGFPRASTAEKAGRHLTQTVLLLATSLDFGLRLNYHSHDAAVVFDRFKSDGLTIQAFGKSYWPQDVILQSLSSVIECDEMPDAVLLSMELYCAGVLEGNGRARFISMVSALEPLAQQQRLGDDVDKFVAASTAHLATLLEIPEKLRQSLIGRLNELRRESIRQALQRLCEQWFPSNSAAWAAIDHAYRLRSQLIHEGALANPDIDISEETQKIQALIRAIYQKAAGFNFRAPPVLPKK
jgi:hypothetical protein